MSLYEREVSDLAGIRACADAHGFCLVRGVFTSKEVSDIQAGMKLSHEAFAGHIPDLLSCPPLRDILFDARILGIARALLGNDLIYYPETSVNYEETVGPITLQPFAKIHCDAVGTPNELLKTWRSPTDAPYRGYRFGLYLQDYEHYSGGLKLCAGTHRGDPDTHNAKSAETNGLETMNVGERVLYWPKIDFPLYNVPSHPGDLVVWNLRTFHAAGALLLRDDPTRALHPDVEKFLQEQMPEAFLPIPGPRLTIFFDLAAPAEDIDLYIKARTQRYNTQKFHRLMYSCHDKDGLISLAHRHGIRMRFDYLITTLVVGLIEKRTSDPQAVIARVLAMADQHEEFSPHFPLFDRARYRAVRDKDAGQALNVVFDGVMQHVASLAKTRKNYLSQALAF